jgi:hypothetical protein
MPFTFAVTPSDIGPGSKFTGGSQFHSPLVHTLKPISLGPVAGNGLGYSPASP